MKANEREAAAGEWSDVLYVDRPYRDPQRPRRLPTNIPTKVVGLLHQSATAF